MKDLYEKEEQVLSDARQFVSGLGTDTNEEVREEFTYLVSQYEQLLRQLRWVTRISDLTALGLNTDKTTLLNKVNVDALTEIYNRRFLITNLQNQINSLRSTGEWITVMMLDVDFFKNYNDTYGHTVGDNCLRKIATTIHNSLSGADDFVVRYGGEEFVAVLPNADKGRAMHVGQKILDEIRKLQIPHERSQIANCVTISIGVVSAIPKEGRNMPHYIDKADAALYLSKKNGRDRITSLDFEEDK